MSDSSSKDSSNSDEKYLGTLSESALKESLNTDEKSSDVLSVTKCKESPPKGNENYSSSETPLSSEQEMFNDKKNVANNPALPENEDGEESVLLERMRGDAVGNTLYSERFILKTILALMSQANSKEETFEQLETDLCSVWDMTIEEDVAELLLQKDFLAIFLHVIEDTENLRLIEILVGMLGNICCHDCGFKSLTEQPSVIELLFRLTTCMDSSILIQLMRLLETVMAKLKNSISTEGKIWYCFIGSFDNFAQKFAFILKMCKSEEVLKGSLKALNAILAICALVEVDSENTNTNDNNGSSDNEKLRKFSDIFLNAELIDGTNIAFCYVMRISGVASHNDDDTDNEEMCNETINEYIQVYINIHTILCQNGEDSIRCYEDQTVEIAKCLAFILYHYVKKEDALTLAKDTLTYIEGIIHIQNCLNNPFYIHLFKSTLKAWQLFQSHLGKLKKNPVKYFNEFESNDLSSEICEANCELLLNFLMNMVKGCNIEIWKNSLLKIPREEINILLDAFDAKTNNNDFRQAASNLRQAIKASKRNTEEPDDDYL